MGLLDILKEQKAMRLKGGIYHHVQIDLTYNSNHIEGSRLTHDQTRYIFETNTIGITEEAVNVDDVVETVNHFRCIDYVIEHAESYNAQKSHTFEDILDFHVRFESIHPFQDGNGRVGRLLMFKACLASSHVPFIITDELKMFYYRGLREWGHVNGYLTDTCLTAQDNFKALLDYFKTDAWSFSSPTHRNSSILGCHSLYLGSFLTSSTSRLKTENTIDDLSAS